MTDLIARLEAAEAGSFYLSKAVMASFGFTWRGMNYWNDADEIWRGSGAVTESFDAALALASRVLDQRGPININICLAGSAQVVIDSVGPCNLVMAQVVASTPALALCAAILRAKGSDQ